MKVKELIAKLEEFESPEARVRLIVNTRSRDRDLGHPLLMQIGIVYDDALLTASDSPPGSLINIQAHEWAVVSTSVEEGHKLEN